MFNVDDARDAAKLDRLLDELYGVHNQAAGCGCCASEYESEEARNAVLFFLSEIGVIEKI